MRLTKHERETIIIFNEAESERTVYTCSPSIMTKLDRHCEKHPKYWQLKEKDSISKTYTTNKRLISFRSAITKRDLTDEERQELAERLARSRA